MNDVELFDASRETRIRCDQITFLLLDSFFVDGEFVRVSRLKKLLLDNRSIIMNSLTFGPKLPSAFSPQAVMQLYMSELAHDIRLIAEGDFDDAE